MIKGIPFQFGEETLILPPLSRKALRPLEEQLKRFTGRGAKPSIAFVTDTVFTALKRNYPDITRERVGELIDVGNMPKVMQALVDAGAGSSTPRRRPV